MAHEPVLLGRVLELVAPAVADRPAVCVDATVGLGGHAEALLRAHPRLRILGLDRDPDALEIARGRLGDDRVELVHAVYDELPQVLAERGLDRVDAVVFDLGVSSLQLDQPARGFSYATDAPLDMRMDPSADRTAAQVINTYPVPALARILREYGEERFARRVAQAIDRERRRTAISSSARLAEIVRAAIPAATRRTGGHPAKRSFQALRIEVNAELAVLRRALPAAVSALSIGGRIAVLSYHSLEDRIVKRTLVAGATSSAPVDLPLPPPGTEPELRLLTRGGETPTAEEIARNPRAASARLRAAERVREAA